MRVLILDDMESRHRVFRERLRRADRVHVRTYREAVEALKGERFDLVYLDRDLGDEIYGGCDVDGKNGEDVAYHIAELPPRWRPLLVIVHSWNYAGAQRMEAMLEAVGVNVRREPFNDD